MGNCLSHPSDVRYSTIPAYGPPPERLQTSAHQQQSGLQAKAGAGLSSPRKPLGGTRDAHVADQCDGQQHGEEHQQQQAGQQQQQQPLQWHSPSTTGERSQHYGGSAAAAAGDGGQDAAPCGGYEDAEPPLDEEVPFSWTKGELLGAGAFGRVYTALNNANGRLVAVKQVSLAKDEALAGKVAEHIRALEAEVEVLKTLRHENIVRYLGTQRTDDALHIFLEYVSGGSIASLLTRFGPLKEPVIRLYTAQVLRGLEYLHARGIMHRDIKGANILVDSTSTVKLADFGASKKIEDLATIGSGARSIRGTPYWMAPEVIKQTGHGRPADIWSLGCTVIEMATGAPPWSSYSAPVAAMFQIASSKDPPPLPDNLSPEAKDFLLLCFNRVARDRANATRLLKHPFIAKAQVPASLPFPGASPGNASNASNSSPAGARSAAGGPGSRAGAVHASVAGGRAGMGGDNQRAPHTPSGARASSGMQLAGGGAGAGSTNNTSRPQGMLAGAPGTPAGQAAAAAANAARCSPQHGHGSPRRQHQQQQAGGAPGALCQRGGDAAAVVTAVARGGQQPGHSQQHTAKQQDDEQKQKQQQQQSPGAYEMFSNSHTEEQAAAAAAAGRSSSVTPRSRQAPGVAPSPQAQQQACATLMAGSTLDWNPMVEPSWQPGTYQLPPAAAAAAAGGNGSRRDEQQHNPGRGGSSSNGRAAEAAEAAAAAAAGATDAADMRRPPQQQQQQQQQYTPGRGSISAVPAGPMKRATAAAAGGASVLAAGPGSSRSNGGIGSRRLVGGQAGASASGTGSGGGAASTSHASRATGPLAQGPVGRASRESGFFGAATAAAPSAGTPGRNGTGRPWGSSNTAAGGGGTSSQSTGSAGSPAQSASATAPDSAAASVAAAANAGGGDADGDDAPTSAHRTGAEPQQQQQQPQPAHQQQPGQQRYGGGSCNGRSGGRGGSSPSAASELALLSSKHAQWEQELMEELRKQREEQRASRHVVGRR